jgi:hypothetical protein
MALKPDRLPLEYDITRSCSTVSERGVIAAYSTAGSGSAIGNTSGFVQIAVSGSGLVPAGVLMNDVVNIDETRYHRNFMKDEIQINNPVTLVKKGWVVTNMITGTPTVGATAYLGANGNVTTTLSTTGGLVATPKVGMFTSIKDEAGYAKLEVNLPIV